MEDSKNVNADLVGLRPKSSFQKRETYHVKLTLGNPDEILAFPGTALDHTELLREVSYE